MANSNTLQRSINYATILARGAPLSNVLLVANEPALTIGDWVRQFILAPPFAWRWNRSVTAFLAVKGVSIYTLLSWQADLTVQQGWITIDPNGNQQQVSVTGTTGSYSSNIPPWNGTLNGTTTDGTATWVNTGNIGPGISPIQPMGWLEKAVVISADGTGHELEIALNLALEPRQNQPVHISPLLEPISSTAYTFQISPAPDQNYTIRLTQQNAARSFTALTDRWDPIPDYLSFLYNQGIVAKTFEYMNKETYLPEEQLFLRQVIAANAGLTESQVNIFLSDRLNTAREGQSALSESQSGRQSRGAF